MEAHEVGTAIEIHAEDAALIRTVNERLLMLQAKLGQTVDEFQAVQTQFEQAKQEILSALAQAKSEFRSLVMTIGVKMNLNIGEDSSERWEFQADRMVFTRRG